MATDVTDDQIRDTNTHQYPMENHQKDTTVYQYANNLDAEVTVTVYGTYEGDADDFSDVVQLNQKTISGGSADRDALSDPWDYLLFEVTASSSPTSGSLVIKEHQ